MAEVDPQRVAADEALRAAGRGVIVDDRLAQEAAFDAALSNGGHDPTPGEAWEGRLDERGQVLAPPTQETTGDATATRDGDGPQINVRLLPGGDWILDTPLGIPAVWGNDTDEVLWAEGEPLLIVGPAGVGKTTIAGQLMAARVGLIDKVFGYPVRPSAKRVLYLAMDRARQVQRAFSRLVSPDDRALLNERLRVRAGPPPKDLARHPEVLAYLANMAGADTVFIDSLKDAALRLSDDEVGAGMNRAMQTALAEGIEVCAPHHQRKSHDGVKPKALDDVYGSTWLTAGAGSVLLLWGAPGDPLVELTHLKQPGAAVGPLQIEHDHDTGLSSVYRGFEPLRYLRNQPNGVTATQAAQARYEKEPTENQTRIMRRTLDKLVAKGQAHKREAVEGGREGTTPARWYPVETTRSER